MRPIHEKSSHVFQRFQCNVHGKYESSNLYNIGRWYWTWTKTDKSKNQLLQFLGIEFS